MQGNSKYLRWSPLYTCCCVFVILSSTVIAVPVRQRRMVSETTYFDTVASNTISNATCFRDGIEVQKSSVKCEIKTGCKLIQKTGECCPEYQCECNHEDRTYVNGDKIVSHNPCRRCVCKGGEVTCNDVSCYIRDDCKPRYIVGRCCPEFDNCPPIADVKIPAAKESDSKKSKNDVIISLASNKAANASHKDDKNTILQLANENPLGIKIKEITKPEEIRITDDKPKPYNPFKSTTTTTTIAPTTTETTEATSTSTEWSTVESTSTENARDVTTEDTNRSVGEHESRDLMLDNSSDAPPIKAATDVLLGNGDSNSITDDSGKSVRQTTENSINGEIDQTSEAGFSSTTELSTTESSTPFSDTSTVSGEEFDLASPTPETVEVENAHGEIKSYTVSGTEGLVRVEVVSSTTENSQEEDADVTPSSETPSSETPSSETPSSETPSSETPLSTSTETIENRSTEEFPLDSSSTTSIPELFDDITADMVVDKQKGKTSIRSDSSAESVSSTEILSESSSEFTLSSKVYEPVYYPSPTTAAPLNEDLHETVYYSSTDSSYTLSTRGPNSSTESSLSTTELISEIDDFMSSTPQSSTAEPMETSSSCCWGKRICRYY